MAYHVYRPDAKSPNDSLVKDDRQMAFYELDAPSQSNLSMRIDHSFPEEFVDILSQLEVFNKHLFRPNTYLHKWWARRCGTTFRAILKQFVPFEEGQDYYAPGGLEGKTVLDPMMGGGTILHEAIRLGANVIGADIDPIPIVQARASLTQAELSDLQASFQEFSAELQGQLGHYFQTECPVCSRTCEILYTLHGIGKRCSCKYVVQIDQYTLRQEEGRIVAINPHDWRISADTDVEQFTNGSPVLISKNDKQCRVCGEKYSELLEMPFYSRYMPVAIAAYCPEHGQFFRSPSEDDLARIEQADQIRKELDFGDQADFKVEDGPKSGDLLRHAIPNYLDVFSSRQLLYLNHAIRQLQHYTGIDKLSLGMLVSTSLEFNSMLCGYKGWYKRRPGAIRHVFALHAYSLQYTALENNPVNSQKASGNLRQLFHDRIERGRMWSLAPVERRFKDDGKTELVKISGELDNGTEVLRQSDLAESQRRFLLIQGDSCSLPIEANSIDLIITDPPYYDNVQYSDLAAFFRVWLTRLLPEAANWQYDESRIAVSTHGRDGDNQFMAGLAGIFAECGRVLKPQNGRMVFTFHHWDPNAWTELTVALKLSDFILKNAYVVHSEHPISVHIRDLRAIKHDCVLVLASRDGTLTEPWMPVQEFGTEESEEFCRRCARALGWLLESDFSPQEINAIWRGLIKGEPI